MTKHHLAFALFMLLFVSVNVSHATSDDFRQRINQQGLLNYSENDVKAELRLGRELAARILGKYPHLENQDLTRYVTLVGKSLALQSSRTELEYHFAVLDTEDINAYSTPGGYIFVTKGALEKMQNEAELAAVLAHEIAHVTERHLVKDLDIHDNSANATSSIGQVLGGAGSSAGVAFTQVVNKAAEILFQKGFRQQEELDADRVGTLLLATAGYDPLALQRYLRRIHESKNNNVHTINTTHPSSQKRVEALARLIREENLDKGEYTVAQVRFADHVSFN